MGLLENYHLFLNWLVRSTCFGLLCEHIFSNNKDNNYLRNTCVNARVSNYVLIVCFALITFYFT